MSSSSTSNSNHTNHITLKLTDEVKREQIVCKFEFDEAFKDGWRDEYEEADE
ncbi:MAG: hypothetical protein FIO02_09680 [Nitrosopumilales archaeon]|nr:hypothetical protein [Nitrosopumilales archaeon]